MVYHDLSFQLKKQSIWSWKLQ